MDSKNRPVWFKLFLSQKAVVDAVPDDTAGKAIKAIFHYFETGEMVELSPLELVVFSSIKPYVDESFKDFEKTSRRNKENIAKRWAKDTTCTTGIKSYHSLPLIPLDTKNTEEEEEKEEEGELEEDCCYRGKQPTRRFTPPTLEEVTDYCDKRCNSIDPERFMDYYTANGWMVGKNRMKDWKAAIRTWERGNGKGQQTSQGRKTKADELEDFYKMTNSWVADNERRHEDGL